MARKTLWIDIDDVGWWFYFTDSTMRIPNIRKMMAHGRTFLNFWSGPLCSNFRGQRETGLYPHRPNNLMGNVIDPTDTYSLPTGHAGLLAKCIPDAEQIGKWHLAKYVDTSNHRADCGYVRWAGAAGNLIDGGYSDWIKVVGQAGLGVTTFVSDHYVTLDTAADILDAIEREVPFICASFNAPHNRFHTPPRALHSYELPLSTTTQQVKAMMEALDKCLGRVMYAALKAGYIIGLGGDNGTTQEFGGEKGSFTQRGMHSPLVWRGPGIPEGTTSTSLVSAVDLYATLIELAEGTLTGGEDSVSFADDIFGGTFVGKQFNKCDGWSNNGNLPVESDWTRAVRDERYKLIVPGTQPHLFYDLELDPDEDNPLDIDNLDTDVQAHYDAILAEVPTL